MGRIFVQNKIVARMRDRHHISGPHGFVNQFGAASTGSVVVDRDDVSVAFALVIHQRVAADHPVRQMQVDVRPGSERRQIATVWTYQLV